jgi:hypothetical protein
MSANTSKQLPNRICILSSVVLVLLSMLVVPSSFSQTASTGALTGTVKDSSGGVVPNVTVTATSIDTAQARTSTTDADGTYRFGLLPPGNYRLRFEAAGFGPVEVPSLTIAVTETAVLDRTLQVGQQSQQVEVSAEAETVQTTNSTVGSLVNSETMTAIPLTSRNYTNLLALSAGASTSVYNAANMGRGTQDIVVNGSSIAQNNYSLDGASIVNFASNGFAADSGANPGMGIVNPDTIQEFKIQTSLYDAGYGRNPGANVNVVTKSGTNQFHGTAFEFFRNTVLNANDFFRPQNAAPQPTDRPVLNQNQYGGTFGGPVKKDKLFFFTSYQETWQKNGLSPAGLSNPTLVGLPLGDRSNVAGFTTALANLYCGKAGSAGGVVIMSPTCGTPAGVGPVNINAVAINILELKNADGSYFIPSSSTGSNQTAIFSVPAHYVEHQALGNVDYVINSKNTFAGRWSYSRDVTNAPMGCGATGNAITKCLPGGPGLVAFTTQYMVGKLTTTVTNNVVNEARLSLQRVLTGLQNQIPFTDTQVGMAPIVPSFNVFNTMTINGLMTWGGQLALASNKSITSWQAADQISWSHGKHTIRAGAEFERDRNNWIFPGLAIGNLTFQSFPDFLLGLPGCAPGTAGPGATQCNAGNPGGTNGTTTSNILNTGTTSSATAPGGVYHAYRIPAGSIFVQDDIKISSNLTVNLGLRWEYDALGYDQAGQNSNVWPGLINAVPLPGTTPATGTLAGFVVPSNYNPALNVAPTVGGLFQSSQKTAIASSTSLKNFAPRIGFAWKPFASNRFVVRGGAGYFYDRVGESLQNKSSVQSFPYAVPLYQSGAANYFSTEAQPYAPAALGWAPRWVNFATGQSSNLNILSTDPNYHTPLTYEWNLNTQYEFASGWLLELAYVGTRGIHQVLDPTLGGFGTPELNQAQLVGGPTPATAPGIVGQLIPGCNTTTLAGCNTVSNASLRVPYLGFSAVGVQNVGTPGDSKYNSFQSSIRKQFSHGFQLQAAYTYARAFSNTAYLALNDQNTAHPYALHPSYRPQRFNVTYSYDLPLGRHEGLLGKFANGWNVAGVTVIQDGTPITITDTTGGTIYGFSGSGVLSTAQFAAGMGNANVATSGSVEQRLGNAPGVNGYFNVAAFAKPLVSPLAGDAKATGYGNSGYGIVLGPGQFNFDATIQKTTVVGGIHEGATLVFRTEFFNMFNHAQFSNPGVVDFSKSASTFGQITSTSVNPRLIQFALKYVF